MNYSGDLFIVVITYNSRRANSLPQILQTALPSFFCGFFFFWRGGELEFRFS